MALNYISKYGYPVNSLEFNSENQTYVSVYADDVNQELAFIDEKTGNTLYTIGDNTPTLQQVLDFNHDLLDGNNFQGTCAGVGNSGCNVISFGSYSAYCNGGNYVTSSGYASAFFNGGNETNAIGLFSAARNIGNLVVAIGTQSAYCNTANNVNSIGFISGCCNSGLSLNSIGYSSGACNTGDCLNAFGECAGFKNSGNNVVTIGSCAGYDPISGNGNCLNSSFIVSNNNIPSYANAGAAIAAITVVAGGVAGNTYFYYNQATGSIDAVRL